ncbi:MAG: hypothetical protein KAY22_03970 [Rhizorhabdus sp.]|uniref:asparagine synthetase B family protein n=1 Tax=Rhizorhabdus sp. TaxID=1968843 RepID=UPI001B750B2E|nr:asparagine synthase-related protein [Rhizorhabdus sp.]MBP8231441.1 hypothetical protein [Rhizorhabdus sp.]
MSAIYGAWHIDGRPGAHAGCERMQQVARAFGPDQARTWDGGEVALGAALLRLLPEDRFDRQPLLGAGGIVTLVADIRLDNRGELGAALALSPPDMARRSDADVLLAAYERWGEAAIDRLVGDFAFAVWDARDRSLLIARDHGDARPLHYHRGKGWFAFASMPSLLLSLPAIGRGLDTVRLARWQLLQSDGGGRSFYEQISSVEPGHLVRVHADGRVDVRRHWRPEAISPLRLSRPEDYVEGLRSVLDQAVEARLRSVRGNALLLSGGLDSAAVATSAAPILAARGERLTAITNVPRSDVPRQYMADARLDEGPFAALVAARHPNIDHEFVHLADADLLAEVERLTGYADQPVMNPLNTAWLCLGYALAARRGNSTVLVGTKGNFGISYTGQHALSEMAERARWGKLLAETGRLRRNGYAERAEYRLYTVVRRALTSRLPGAIRHLRRHPIYADLFPIAPAALQKLGYDGPDDPRLADALSPRLLSWQDWFRHAWGRTDAAPMNSAIRAAFRIDRRDPTGDRRVLEFCLATPADIFLREGQPKWLYRKAFGSRVPEPIWEDRHRGLAASDWKSVQLQAQRPLVDELQRQSATRACHEVVDVDTLLGLAQTLEQADPADRASYYRYHLKLMRGLATGLFTRKASGSNA